MFQRAAPTLKGDAGFKKQGVRFDGDQPQVTPLTGSPLSPAVGGNGTEGNTISVIPKENSWLARKRVGDTSTAYRLLLSSMQVMFRDMSTFRETNLLLCFL
ncbi:hypothetical protein CDAR_56131 [Caerostris darwini]|uniref:Uncharacterized protein n=1 Tax=Caerostris darwini TaxID=1538125 RepID=A0AAV4RQJ3_9ARAC|nr:hypothetical protein CDAR_56131 [Caerostris darwini]